MSDFIYNLRFIFKPSFWMMMSKYDKEWDKVINDALDDPKSMHFATNIAPDYFTFTINNIEIWARNYPYAYGTPGGVSRVNYKTNDRPRPSRRTIIRLKEFELAAFILLKTKNKYYKTLETLYDI